MKICTTFEEQKGTRYTHEKVYFDIILFISLSSAKQCLEFQLICFVRKIKGFYLISWGNEVDFMDIMYVSAKILVKRLKFKKTETAFCRWMISDYSGINIFLLVENACTVLLEKEQTQKRIFKTNCKLFQNHTGKQLMRSTTTLNWLYNDIWCYLVIDCFD